MTLLEVSQLLGNFGEFVGAIAVVATLFYLTLQIRKNTEAIKLATTESIVRGIIELNRMPIENEEVNEILMRGTEDPQSLSRSERSRFNGLANILIYGWQRNYYSFKKKALEDDIWEGQQRSIEITLSTPGYRRRWERLCPFLGKEFRAFVESEILPKVDQPRSLN